MTLEGESNQLQEVFLVVGSDTGVGKTVFTGLLGRYLLKRDLSVALVKPFCSGDVGDINFLKRANAESDQSEVNYWYGDEPISPAAWELRTGEQIDLERVLASLKREIGRKKSDIILIEGVGGLLAPLNKRETVASLGQSLGAKLIVVAPNRVGVVNHVLLTLETALSRGFSVSSVILMEQEEPDTSAVHNAELVLMHMPNIPDFKGVFEFICLGNGADDPDLIANNVKKAEDVLRNIFDVVISPCLFDDSSS